MTGARDWGRFTVYGGDAVERSIRDALDEAGSAVELAVPEGSYRALILLGGYGRGEGGVETVDGVEKPHNNFDFLLVANSADPAEHARLKTQADEVLEPLADRHGIGMDLSVIGAAKLQCSPCLVIWYDMRHGHKTIRGDADFVPALTRYRVDRVVPADVRNLLVNRGTLLVINDLLLEDGELDELRRRTVVKHAVKAVIGYGDAWLFFRGVYDWSYREKQRRMKRRADIDPEFRKIYDDAMEFRFRPDYDAFRDRDLAAWQETLRAVAEPIHRECEAARLRYPQLTWSNYLDRALRHVLVEEPGSARAWARKAVRGWRGAMPRPSELSMLARLGLRAAGWRGALPLLFPLIAYRLEDSHFRAAGAAVLGSQPDVASLRRRYLDVWGQYGDENFGVVLRKLGLGEKREAVSLVGETA